MALTASLCAAQQNPPDPPPKIEAVRTAITVNERIVADAPAAISSVSATELAQTPGVNIDDRLRQVPGFSLFRRSSSLVANPTTQGVSLRGLGSTGASRTLVLWDGVPTNDPFGGWVYWTRIPPSDIDRVEVSRGASTSVFGDRAMAGAIGIFSREAERLHFEGGYEAGNYNTHELDGGVSALWHHVAASAHIRAFSSDGYFVVPVSIRGPVDTPANVRFVAGNTRLDLLGGSQRLFIKLDILAEERDNGTVLTHNSTQLGTLSGTYTWQNARDGASVMFYHTREEFHASFSAIGAGRRTETLSYNQQVPSQATGGAAMWSHTAAVLSFLGGADFERAQGTSTDRLNPTGARIGGGNRLQHGVFGQVNLKAGPAQFFLGARHAYTGGGDTFFSPTAGVVVGHGAWRARGSVYRSFRAPTLNELYREFRVGNTITQANADLRPEVLLGGEFGADYTGESRRFGVTFFRNSLDDLITNVTLRTGATTIRQRQNAASALAQGVEADFKQRWRDLRLELSYLYADSRYVTGPRIPQVAKSQGSAMLSYSRGGTLASFGLRSYSLQFDDDLNLNMLPGFSTLQASVRRRLIRRFTASLVFENLLNREYLTGAGTAPTIGAPRLVRAGLGWR